MAKLYLLLGSLNALLVVVLGAFGAHALRGRLSEAMLGVYQTGIQYHFYHAVGLLLLGLLALHSPGMTLLRWSGGLMLAGIILFSGSLYILAVSGQRWWGMITPVGGLAFILAWLLFMIAVYRGM